MRVVIPVCDKYTHLIPANVHFLRANWAECPEITVVACTERIENVQAEVVYVGQDQQFASNVLLYLDHHCTDDVVLLWLDDFFLSQADADAVAAAERLVQDGEADCVRLSKMFTPVGRPYEPDKRFCYIDKDAQYALSLQAAIWRRDVLRGLLVPGETPWETELEGTTRVRERKHDLRPFLGAAVPILEYQNFYFKGTVDVGACVWTMQRWPRGRDTS